MFTVAIHTIIHFAFEINKTPQILKSSTWSYLRINFLN